MKKYLSVILVFVLVLIGISINKQEIEAVSINFDYGNISPRFQYLYDDVGSLIPFEFIIYEQYDHPRDIETFEISLELITYRGLFIKTLERFNVTPFIPSYDSYIREGDETYIADGDTGESEYLYVGNINFLFGGFDYLQVIEIRVEGTPISPSEFEASVDNQYIILDPATSGLGDTIVIDYLYEFEDNYIGELEYDWSGIVFQEDEEVAFYRVRYNNLTLMTGAVMNSAEDNLEYDEYGLEFGDYLVRGNGNPDFSDQNDFTTEKIPEDDYWILHYRIPEALIDAFGHRTYRITKLSSNTIEFSFTSDDLLSVQGGSTVNFANSFMIMPIGDTVGEGLSMSFDAWNDLHLDLLHEYDPDSYFISLVDQTDGNAYLASASVVWNITEEEEHPFILSLLKDEISITDLQRVIFYKTDEDVTDTYTTVLAKDYASDISYVDEINATSYTYAISYYLDDTVDVDECVFVRWRLDPSFIPYSLDEDDYQITLVDEYCAIAETDIGGHIDNLLIYYAFDDELGGWIFAIIVLLILNVILVMTKVRATFIYSFVNAVVVLMLSFLGIMPMWMIIGVFLLVIIGFKNVMSGGVSYE